MESDEKEKKERKKEWLVIVFFNSSYLLHIKKRYCSNNCCIPAFSLLPDTMKHEATDCYFMPCYCCWCFCLFVCLPKVPSTPYFSRTKVLAWDMTVTTKSGNKLTKLYPSPPTGPPSPQLLHYSCMHGVSVSSISHTCKPNFIHKNLTTYMEAYV